jgi:hypothetical protein
LQNLAPEEGSGPLRKIPYSQLPVGIYDIEKTKDDILPPDFLKLFSEFKRQVGDAARRGDLPQARGVLIVEDWQVGLKRVTFRILWSEPEDNRRKTMERINHLHRDRLRGPT